MPSTKWESRISFQESLACPATDLPGPYILPTSLIILIGHVTMLGHLQLT
jgi:hypothetical protein